jgi:hypothetical protein
MRRAFLLFLVLAAPCLPCTISKAVAQADPTPSAIKPTPSPPQTPAGGDATSALVLDSTNTQTLLGLPVRTSKGEDLGHVVEVVVDRNGALLAAIVDFGGFLGVGSRKIAVDWRILHFPKSGGMQQLIADLPLDRLRDAPAFKPGEPIVIMGAPATSTQVGAAPAASPSPADPKP